MRPSALIGFLCLIAASVLSGCGFTPIYATPSGTQSGGLRNIYLSSLSAPAVIDPLLREAYATQQGSFNSQTRDYDLVMEAEEGAQRLAVQNDGSVTRFNYRLRAEYRLVRRTDGHTLKGTVSTISAFNVVDSQYSTLYAENTARERAARTLIEELERDILLRLEDDRIGEDERIPAVPELNEFDDSIETITELTRSDR